jgi:hypothetical protein
MKTVFNFSLRRGVASENRRNIYSAHLLPVRHLSPHRLLVDHSLGWAHAYNMAHMIRKIFLDNRIDQTAVGAPADLFLTNAAI